MKKYRILILILVIISVSTIWYINYYNLIPKKTYTNSDFDIKDIVSNIDYDNDLINDYKDILLGAREYVNSKPKYKSKYYVGGYPTDNYGVCTDVIWYAFKQAGYSIKDMVDEDIKNNLEIYQNINKPDPNIDFRRVKNLKTFFERYAISLTTDINDIDKWQGGDVVIFKNHIAIVSDKRNKDGITYIIHHAGQPVYEEDAMWRYEVIGHYRWTNKNER